MQNVFKKALSKKNYVAMCVQSSIYEKEEGGTCSSSPKTIGLFKYLDGMKESLTS